MKVEDIRIKDIDVIENVRVTMKDRELHELMESIKQHGLKQPIGVVATPKGNKYILVFGHRRLEACKKLGHETIPASIHKDIETIDVLLLNVTENVQRKDISPIELGRICDRLKNMSLTPDEIAVRLSIPSNKVETAIKLFNGMPMKHRERIVFSPKNTRVKAGQVPATTARAILELKRMRGLSDRMVDKLLSDTRFYALSSADMGTIARMIDDGYSATDALKEIKNYKNYRLDICLEKSIVDKAAEKMGVAPLTYLQQVIYGLVPAVPKPKFVKY